MAEFKGTDDLSAGSVSTAQSRQTSWASAGEYHLCSDIGCPSKIFTQDQRKQKENRLIKWHNQSILSER